MKTIWGFLLIGCCLLNSQSAQAEKWVPFFGLGVSHNMVQIYSWYENPEKTNATILDKGIDKADIQVSIGVRGNRLGIVFRVYRTDYDDIWAERRQNSVYSWEHSKFSKWKDDRALLGIQYFLTKNKDNPLRFLAEGGFGMGMAWYSEKYLHCGGCLCNEYQHEAKTPTFFLQYAGVGAVLNLGRRMDMEMNWFIHHASVNLDEHQFDSSLESQTTNWMSAIQLSAIIKLTN